ncbi:branched-chain amino acid ABC transporter permease [Halocalculus aciditolerans]|uniref:Branched-chain amino acid ABC transporter permease n=1 Tax=Halocalculus aciditolerans TaxID=1383812 RepID=A0A830FD19_9EURY|nr:branched-chain amino acid ABC transporter permease [Halocalculus aciditolerans]GGL63033.1 branched-chain amino acid ABC transporter permease [Halocalculus aciditolerans]
MSALLQYVVNGLVYSAIIVLASIGLSLVYSIRGFANFAHGDTLTVGAYAALITFSGTSALLATSGSANAEGGLAGLLGGPAAFVVALAVGMAVAAVVAIASERLVFSKLDTSSIGLLIASIGVAFVMRAIVQIFFGNIQQAYQLPRSGPLPFFSALGVAVTARDVVVVVATLVLVAALHAILQYTSLGRQMRATSDNRDLARASGIRTSRIVDATWAIGAGLAGAGGVFLGLSLRLEPLMGFNILLVVFAAVILGGIGSVYGAMLGGLVIGVVHEFVPALSSLGIPISAQYANAVAFLIMVVILLVRPQGIMGEAVK